MENNPKTSAGNSAPQPRAAPPSSSASHRPRPQRRRQNHSRPRAWASFSPFFSTLLFPLLFFYLIFLYSLVQVFFLSGTKALTSLVTWTWLNQSKTTTQITTPHIPGRHGPIAHHPVWQISGLSSSYVSNPWLRRLSDSAPLAPNKSSPLWTNGTVSTPHFAVLLKVIRARAMRFPIRFPLLLCGIGLFSLYLLDGMPLRLIGLWDWERRGRPCQWKRLRILGKRWWGWG